MTPLPFLLRDCPPRSLRWILTGRKAVLEQLATTAFQHLTFHLYPVMCNFYLPSHYRCHRSKICVPFVTAVPLPSSLTLAPGAPVPEVAGAVSWRTRGPEATQGSQCPPRPSEASPALQCPPGRRRLKSAPVRALPPPGQLGLWPHFPLDYHVTLGLHHPGGPSRSHLGLQGSLPRTRIPDYPKLKFLRDRCLDCGSLGSN